FCYERRQEVIDYVIRRYGTDHVAQIVTFGTMAAKAAVRDVARVTGVPYSTADMVSRLIPQSVNMTLGKALESSKDLKQLYDSDLSVHDLIDTAAGVEGMPRNTSTHPAGVVICDTPVSDHVPLMARDGVVSSQYTMTALEKVGLLKIDFLGLRNLTIISDCEKTIRKKHPDFSVDKISYDDPETYEMLTRGDTVGVFQFESAGMTRLLGKLHPRSIEDLTAALSLYRPGPMDSIPKYLENRLHPEKITYAHPILEDILNVTCGCIVYQEQVMEICRKMAGYSYGRADIVRRNMAKKKHGEMEKERSVFVEGAVKNGVPEDVANAVFDEMAGFASYAFNKSHAAAYSVVAFRTAYLKCHYFKEYMAALMTAFTDFTGKLMEYISCCEHRGVKILRPDINESGVGFTAVDEGIRFSLTAAKNIGRNAVEEIVSEREKNGSFKNLGDLIKRMSGKDFSRRTGESLIKSGALDCFPLNRRQMLENYDRIAAVCADITGGAIEGQLDFFGMSGESITADIESSVPYSEEYDYERLLDMEKEILGIYISGHPLQRERTVAKAMRLPDIAQMQHMKEGTAVSAVFEVASVKTHYARNGAQMAFAVFEDMSGETEAVIFPSVYTAAKPLLTKGAKIYAEGKISTDREGNNNFLPDRIFSAGEFMENTLKKCTLYIRTNSYDKQKTDKCIALLRENVGENKLYFRFEDIKKTIA
ncbi:MAG: DNA polymerase III subunit alpha, partial [Huintestinicola sp.]